jgi:hypothetical protein
VVHTAASAPYSQIRGRSQAPRSVSQRREYDDICPPLERFSSQPPPPPPIDRRAAYDVYSGPQVTLATTLAAHHSCVDKVLLRVCHTARNMQPAETFSGVGELVVRVSQPGCRYLTTSNIQSADAQLSVLSNSRHAGMILRGFKKLLDYGPFVLQEVDTQMGAEFMGLGDMRILNLQTRQFVTFYELCSIIGDVNSLHYPHVRTHSANARYIEDGHNYKSLLDNIVQQMQFDRQWVTRVWKDLAQYYQWAMDGTFMRDLSLILVYLGKDFNPQCSLRSDMCPEPPHCQQLVTRPTLYSNQPARY